MSGFEGYGGGVTVPPTAAGQLPRPSRRWPRTVALTILIAAGLAGVVGGGAGLAAELTRAATPAEAAAALRVEIGSRWSRLPAGQIFPATVAYQTTGAMNTQARRVGIAPAASCATALDPRVAAALRGGCVTVLRATYADASGTLVVTEGVAVMRSPAAAGRASASVPAGQRSGVRAVAFPRTWSARFGNAQRNAFGLETVGPYIFFYAAGYADGRPSAGKAGPAEADLGRGVLLPLEQTLTSSGQPCRYQDIRC